jgi:tetratricopeptide (TPR) repeat protein
LRVERALLLDPSSAWAHYALAHLEAKTRNWDAASRELQTAIGIEPTHLAARRLEAALLVRNGRADSAARALELWLDAAELDLRVDPAARLTAQLDLALLWVQLGEPSRARTLLLSLGGGEVDALRRLCILAAAEEETGRPRQALEAARAAEAVDPSRSLPLVQQAMLYEQWLDDRERARDTWQRLISGARSQGELSDLIQSMRARVVLERLDAQASPPTGDPSKP